jgi:hypothetical protein
MSQSRLELALARVSTKQANDCPVAMLALTSVRLIATVIHVGCPAPATAKWGGNDDQKQIAL